MLSALSFSQRIALAVIMIVMLFVGGVGYLSYQAMNVASQKNFSDELNYRALNVSKELEGRLRGLNRSLSEMASNTLIGNALVDNIGRDVYLASFLDGFHLIEGIPVEVLVTDFMGRPFSSNIKDASLLVKTQWVEEAIEKNEMRSTIVPLAGAVSFVLIKPVLYANTGLPEGALIYQFLIKDLLDQEEIANDWETSTFLTGLRLIYQDKATQHKGAITSGVEGPGALVNIQTLKMNGTLSQIDLSLEVFGNPDPIQQLLGDLLRTHLVMGVIALLLAVGGGLLVSRLLTNKLSGLEASASIIATDGKLSKRLTVEGVDEISRFAGAFNLVLDRLDAAYRELENQAQLQIDQQREKYQRVVEQAGEALMIIDPQGKVVEANPRSMNMLGYTAEETGNLDISVFVKNWEDIGLQNHFLKVKNQDVETFEVTFVTKDQAEIPVEVTAGIVDLENGPHLLWMARDISERKLTEIKLRKLTSAVEQSPATVMVTDLKGKIEYVNPKFEESTGYTIEEAMGRSPNILKSGTTTPDEYKALWETISSGEEWRGEFQNKRKDGSLYWEAATISPVKTPDGDITNYLAIKEDITERKKAEKELRKAKAMAEEANRAKSEFLAAMSHDLRTPLNAIMGFAEMMELRTFGDLGDPHYEKYAKNIHDSGNLLVSLINDVLDLSKVEAGKYDLVEQKLDTADLINATVTMIRPQAQAKDICLSAELPDSLPYLFADERVLVQILNNLLSNAIKFTLDGGRVVLSSRVNADAGLTITITDSGIGMSKAEIKKAMLPFEQVNNSDARQNKGTGLGLPLCMKFIELHGGSMTIESKKKKGTSVSVHLPRDRVLPTKSTRLHERAS